MIKYYCDLCGKEIPEGELTRVGMRCRALIPNYSEIETYFHRECAVKLIGEERIAKMQAEKEARDKAAAERKAAREKKLIQKEGEADETPDL